MRGKLRSARAMPESAAESALWMTGRRTHASIHSTQNTADLKSDKCARRRRREILSWGSRSHSYVSGLFSGPRLRRAVVS